MPDPSVTVVIPTLRADEALAGCIESLERQSLRDFEAVIVDNSGRGLVRRLALAGRHKVIENERNVGFGAAINQGIESSKAPFLARGCTDGYVRIASDHGRRSPDRLGGHADRARWQRQAARARLPCGPPRCRSRSALSERVRRALPPRHAR
ncbi:MAG: glycosyltransferase [Acidobacteria bacterium]|nr:glycosyltransferase [Acidobacteriota bacterium]